MALGQFLVTGNLVPGHLVAGHLVAGYLFGDYLVAGQLVVGHFIFHLSKKQASLKHLLFILVHTTTKSIQFINKPVFLLSYFIVDILLLLAKQQQQKSVNLYTISVCYAWALEASL
jgi:hypothetical protein